MRILPISDLHLEFHSDAGLTWIHDNVPDDSVDVVVIAGDLTIGELLHIALRNLSKIWKKQQIVAILGNHDLYHSSPEAISEILDEVKKEKLRNLHILRNSSVTIKKQKFVGGTLWFEDDPMNAVYARDMNDFECITGFVPWVYKENKRCRDLLAKEVDGNSIVVTHHLPSSRCIDEGYKGSNLNRFYISPSAENILLEKSPKLWLHGHSHSHFDKVIEKTRVVRNPKGYWGYESKSQTGFDPKFVIEL
jgi:Icc-related predicted phosphoesterase